MDKKWNNKLKDSFSEFQLSEPDGLWEEIGKELDRRQSLPAGAAARSGRSGPIAWPYWAGAVAAAVAALLLVTVPGRFNRSASEKSVAEEHDAMLAEALPATEIAEAPEITEVNMPDSEPLVSPSYPTGLNNVSASSPTRPVSEEASSPTRSGIPSDDTPQDDRNVQETEKSPSGDASLTASADPAVAVTDPTSVTESAEAKSAGESDGAASRSRRSNNRYSSYPEKPYTGSGASHSGGTSLPQYTTRSKQAGRLTAAVFSNAQGPISNQGTGYGFHHSPLLAAATRASTNASGTDFMSLAQMTAANSSSVWEAIHRMSFRGGVNFSYSFDDHWSLASGLTYAILSSTFIETSGQLKNTSSQTIEMAGVPIQVQYGWRTGKDLRLYALAGMSAEKAVRARSITGNNIVGIGGKSSTGSFDLSGIWLTAEVGAGLEVALFNGIGLYLEPTLQYHLPGLGSDNGAAVDFLYTARPLSPGLTLGLRYSL